MSSNCDNLCIICRNVPIVPVRLDFFVRTGDSCLFKKRFCLRCAHSFLKINSNDEIELEGTVRCPLCNDPKTTTNYSRASEYENFCCKIDYELMSVLSLEVEEVDLEPFTCDCGAVFRNQRDIYHHIRDTCGLTFITCTCNKKFKRCDMILNGIRGLKCVDCFLEFKKEQEKIINDQFLAFIKAFNEYNQIPTVFRL